MLKEAFAILLTHVCAHQTVRIEIHNPAFPFYTDFAEDWGCDGLRIGCGGNTGSVGWQINSVPPNTPALTY